LVPFDRTYVIST